MPSSEFARPVLGIICCNRMVGLVPSQSVYQRYVYAAMTYADCQALLIPAVEKGFDAQGILSRLDGVLLTGSASNMQPKLYDQDCIGEAESDDCGPFDVRRDSVSMALIKAAIAAKKPIFGICRGFQEINVAFGGSLRRDLGHKKPDMAASIAHHADEGVEYDAMFAHQHEVILQDGGILLAALNDKKISVNSVHFQGIDRLGEGLMVEAIASDGVVEAISANVEGSQILAVQWHPEWQADINPRHQAYFRLIGRALRGKELRS